MPTRVEAVPERTGVSPSPDDSDRSIWRVTLPDEMRDERAAAVLRDVDRARALLPSDPVRARRFLDGSKNADSELARVLFGLVRAEIGGIFDDIVAVEINLSSTLKHMADFPSGFRVQVADVVLSIGERFGAYDAAAAAVKESLGVRRGLVDVLGTPESRRDLSVSLDNVGRVAEIRGDWGVAGRAYEESLGVARGLVDVLGTPESRRDLSVSLNNVGRVAEARGDWGAAGRAYEESLDLARGLADSLGTPESLHDLVISLSNLAGVVEQLGDAERAESLRAERDRIAKILDSGSSET